MPKGTKSKMAKKLRKNTNANIVTKHRRESNYELKNGSFSNMACQVKLQDAAEEEIERKDFHAWVVKLDGTIYDCDTKRPSLVAVYNQIAEIRLGHTDYTFVHKEWEDQTQFKKTEKEMLGDIVDVLPPPMVWEMFRDEYGYCQQRAVIIANNNKTTRVAYGSLGLKCNKTSNIWWEHGDGEY